MKYLVMLLTILTCSCFAAEDVENKAIQTIATLIQQGQTEKMDKVWPGYDLSHTPLFITFKNGHVYAFNFKSGDTAWQLKKVGQEAVLFSPVDKWGLLSSPMNPNFPIEGQEAFVFNIDSEGDISEKKFEILVHERFHRYQFGHFAIDKSFRPYADHLNVDNLALMQLEEILLGEFLGAPNAKKLEILKNFGAIHIYRQNHLERASLDWEEHQQTMEGLADYVSLKIYDVFPIFSNYSGKEKVRKLLGLYAQDQNIADRSIKWRHYGVGSALAYALDFLEVNNWKKQVEEGKTLSELLAYALRMNQTEISSRVEQVKKSKHYHIIYANTHRNLESYTEELAQLQSDYDHLEGIPLSIGRPKHLSISGGGMTARNLILADTTSISLRDTSVMTTSDKSWELRHQDIPFLFQDGGNHEFKVELDTRVVIDGRSWRLLDLVKAKGNHPFKQIVVEGKKSRFRCSNHSGFLTVQQNGRVVIKFT